MPSIPLFALHMTINQVGIVAKIEQKVEVDWFGQGYASLQITSLISRGNLRKRGNSAVSAPQSLVEIISRFRDSDVNSSTAFVALTSSFSASSMILAALIDIA